MLRRQSAAALQLLWLATVTVVAIGNEPMPQPKELQLVAPLLLTADLQPVELHMAGADSRAALLHLVPLHRGGELIFFLQPLRPVTFPVVLVSGNGSGSELPHSFRCHYSAQLLSASGQQQQQQQQLTGWLSLCDGFLRGSLPVNRSHHGRISPAGKRLRQAANGLGSVHLHTLLAHPASASETSVAAAADDDDGERNLLLDLTLPPFWWRRVTTVKHRSRRSLRDIKLGTTSRFLTKNGPFMLQLHLVADSSTYKIHGSSATRTARFVADVVAKATFLYQPLNVFVVVTKLEIHESVVGDYDFKKWSPLLTLQRYTRNVIYETHKLTYDCVHLLVGTPPFGSTAGQANIRVMCQQKTCVGFSTVLSLRGKVDINSVANTMIHEMGHNFGLEHVSDCGEQECLLSPIGSGNLKSTVWSQQSLELMIGFLDSDIRHCLLEPPPESQRPWRVEVSNNWPAPVCGNGLLEGSEQCDCGGGIACAVNGGDKCCDPLACTLLPQATCAAGRCCSVDTCQLLPARTVCRRPKSTECDLPEFCDGQSAECPPDVFVRNGEACDVGRGHCYQGFCGSHARLCRAAYTYWTAPCKQEHSDECQEAGCHGYLRARPFLPFCAFSRSKCLTRYCSETPKASGFGRVPDGAACGNNNDGMCLEGRCQSAREIRAGVGHGVGCSGAGVVNSRGNCHCWYGYGGADCSDSGYGGSVDSGPAGRLSTGRLLFSLRAIGCLLLLLLLLPGVKLLLLLFVVHGRAAEAAVWLRGLVQPHWLSFMRKLKDAGRPAHSTEVKVKVARAAFACLRDRDANI